MKDIVYTRKYTDKNGAERKEYLTVGYIFEKEGRQLILMKSYINLSALTNEKGEVWLGVYEHKSKTADILGIGRKTLHRKLEELNIED